jgi:hypothetical protein
VRSEIAADQRETSGGTAIVEGESERAIGDPSELASTVERPGELADLPSGRLSTREVWEPPPGAPSPPSLDAPAAVRRDWVRERLQMHVDQAIERYRVEGLTPGQEGALLDTPGLERAFRGSRIDQFAKDGIFQDPQLAELITAPDFIGEPDILDSVFPSWFDITTRAQWAAHIRTYGARYGATSGHLLPTD